MDKNQQTEGLGQYLRKNRENSGLSIRAVAALVDVDQAQIIRLEQGKVGSPKAQLLGRLAEVLGLPLADVLTMAGYPTTVELPSIGPYMRAKYGDMTPNELQEVEALVAKIRREHDTTGPAPGEDEN